MTKALLQRDVARVDSPGVRQGMSALHRARPLIAAEDWAYTDPFLRMMEDWFPAGVFDRHPHRGIETVTYMIEGVVEHYDNHGHEGSIGPGDALWLTAGRGLLHNEQPAAGLTVHLLQLWVNLPRADKLVPAAFQELRAASLPLRREPGAEIRVFSGASGEARASTRNHAQVTMLELRLEPGADVAQELPADYNAFVVVLEGAATLGTKAAPVSTGQIAWLTRCDQASELSLTAGSQGLRALLLAGQPLREPVAAHGPFVMNTREELIAAFAEFHEQGERFGL